MFASASLLALSFVATATAQAQQDTTPTKREAPARKPRGDRNKLTQADFTNGGSFNTALDAIRVLRPQWLNPPLGRNRSAYADGSSGQVAQGIVLYIDGVRQPDLDSGLQSVQFAKIFEMRYLDQNRAIQMHGPGHELGVIEVITTDKRP